MKTLITTTASVLVLYVLFIFSAWGSNPDNFSEYRFFKQTAFGHIKKSEINNINEKHFAKQPVISRETKIFFRDSDRCIVAYAMTKEQIRMFCVEDYQIKFTEQVPVATVNEFLNLSNTPGLTKALQEYHNPNSKIAASLIPEPELPPGPGWTIFYIFVGFTVLALAFSGGGHGLHD